MDINEFIQHFAEQFDETDPEEFTPETEFRDNDEWSSLLALSVMAMVDEEYEVQLTANEMRQANTIQDLFNIVNSHL
jgi:acyl carrier protein